MPHSHTERECVASLKLTPEDDLPARRAVWLSGEWAQRAYSNFEDFLERRGVLPRWYDYEAKAQEKALRGGVDEGIEIDGAAKS